MATAYGYARISHLEGFQEGESISAQAHRIEGYYGMMLKASGVAWGGIHQDGKQCSASKFRFAERPAGKALIAVMKPGDHLIIDKLDRMWRSMEDFVRLMSWFKSNQISVHIVDMRGCSVSVGTPMGDFMLSMMAALAQLEASMISSRTRQGLQQRIRMGVYASAFRGKNSPFGIRVEGKKSGRVLYWDEPARQAAKKLAEWWLLEYRTCHEIDAECSKHINLMPASRNRETKGFAHGNGFRRMIAPELCYRILKVTDPNQLRNPEVYANYQKVSECLASSRPDIAAAMLASHNLHEALAIGQRRARKQFKPKEFQMISP